MNRGARDAKHERDVYNAAQKAETQTPRLAQIGMAHEERSMLPVTIASDDPSGWRPIDTAPKDFTGILAVAKGVDGRPLHAIVRWACVTHSHLSSPHDCGLSADCDMRWLGEMGTRYGVEFTHWQPLPGAPY